MDTNKVKLCSSRSERMMRLTEKKTKNQSIHIRRLQRITTIIANVVLDEICEEEFKNLSSSLYFFSKEFHSNEFFRSYESQLELAAINPEKFVKGLYHFYNDMSIKIKNENLYEKFFAFITECISIINLALNSKINKLVIWSYRNLLLGTLNYLSPNKFDFDNIVCGLKTTGEVMITHNLYVNYDIPHYEFIKLVAYSYRTEKSFDVNSVLSNMFKLQGFHINTFNEFIKLDNNVNCYDKQIGAMLIFINEYTYDILPSHPFNTNFIEFLIDIDADEKTLIKSLMCRKRTLPSNGVIFKNISSDIIKSVLMKEIYYNDSIFMLYKIETSYGDISGYYNTKTGYLYSIFLDFIEVVNCDGNSSGADNECQHQQIKRFLLYLYSHAVAMKKNMITGTALKRIKLSCTNKSSKPKIIEPVDIIVYMRGGKLVNNYDPIVDVKDSPRKNNDAFEYKEKQINGYIRKLRNGCRPSEQARELGISLGYDLESDETYVKPFIKQVLCLKNK